MDALPGLLDAPRARGAFALRVVMTPPWSLRIVAESPLTLLAGVTGRTWVVPDSGEPVRIDPGDIVVTRAPRHYNVADSPTTSPRAIIRPGQECCDLNGNSLRDEWAHGIRTWGNDPRGGTVFVVGAYEHLSDVSERLLRALPPVLSLPRAEWKSPLVPMLCDEVIKDEPGQAVVLDRLLDLLLASVLKAWFSQRRSSGPASWRFQGDPIVERALRIMQERPAHPWTMDRLAAQSGASRATLARRFNYLVGESPMAFLRNWRMAMAADLLCRPGETVGFVAEKVGYATPFAFSAAFKRARGISPQEYREGARAIAENAPLRASDPPTLASIVPSLGEGVPESGQHHRRIERGGPTDGRVRAGLRPYDTAIASLAPSQLGSFHACQITNAAATKAHNSLKKTAGESSATRPSVAANLSSAKTAPSGTK